MLEKLKEFQITLLAIVLAFGLIVATKITTNALARDGISVTGSAFEDVKSDTASLRIELQAKESTKATAFNKLKNQSPQVIKYLTDNGILKDDIDILPVSSYPTFKTNEKTGYSSSEIDYYNFTQPIKVSSTDVEKIKFISTDIQKLLDSGVDINVMEPEYSYSQLAELKIKLLENATKDAKSRATGMLKATHNRVGKIQSVKMGVFQITPKDSTNVSDMGINDTSTIDKRVTAVANVIFKIK